jgi:cytochrome c553
MSRTAQLLCVVAALVTWPVCAASPMRAADADALQRYGRHLARECTGCHRSSQPDSAIPPLAGRPADEIVELLQAYRSGRKTNPVMVSVAKSLDDEQSAALAAYFSQLPALPARHP